MKERQSNFELLRIVAMLMVMVQHANYYITVPTMQTISAQPVAESFRILVEEMTIVCVMFLC